jgi:hypothetical protein
MQRSAFQVPQVSDNCHQTCRIQRLLLCRKNKVPDTAQIAIGKTRGLIMGVFTLDGRHRFSLNMFARGTVTVKAHRLHHNRFDKMHFAIRSYQPGGGSIRFKF